MAGILFDEIKNLEFATSESWTLGLPMPSFLPASASLKQLFNIFTGNFLNVFCSTTRIPESKLVTQEVIVNGFRREIPLGHIANGNHPFTFYEDNNRVLSKCFNVWKNLVVDRITNNKLTKYAIPRGVILTTLNKTTGNPTSIYEFFHFYPTQVTEGELTGDPDIMKFSVVFSYLYCVRVL